MSKPFKLSAVLHGHSLDVRTLAVTPENNIISGSRDKTAKFWRPNGFNTGYVEAVTYKDQKNFVASVMYLEPSKEYPDGLVITGGNDNKILIYNLHEPFASMCLEEHTNTVCTLSKGIDSSSFISGSWDASAKYWNLNVSKASQVTFVGHVAAVWAAIILRNTNIVTASADRTIRLWNKDGQQISLINGHNDCVRGLLEFANLKCFLSVSNDATVKIWSYDGSNLNTYYGHTNFIYSICKHPSNDTSFVTSDENRTVKFWQNGENTQSIELPAQSIWCVSCLSNGDIVTGSSDGIIRIFTQDDNRIAESSVLKTFEEEVNALAHQNCQEIGGYKVSDLPGKEALYDPGKKAGQLKMIREPQGVVAYSWVEDGENSHWEKVGDVLGGTNKNTEGKTMYDGQPYDYVFSIDVEDGKPPLKLPFNNGDDPYVTAHNFLTKNELPPSYLDQVANFIIKNSENQPVVVQSQYVDPFTGASRYTPAAPITGTNNKSSGRNADPFTGASSYSTSSNTTTVSTSRNQFFPQNQYRTFDMGDPTVILKKLKEFKNSVTDVDLCISDEELESIAALCTQSSFDAAQVKSVMKLLNWPEETVFPAIDIFRIAVKNDNFNKEVCLKFGDTVLEKLKAFIGSRVPNNVLVTFRALCNLIVHPYGEEMLYKYRLDLLEATTSVSTNNKNIQIGIATFLMNSAMLCIKRKDEIGILMLASVIPDMNVIFNDVEAQFRGFVALGTLLCDTQETYKASIKQKVKENEKFLEKLDIYKTQAHNDSEYKLVQCATEIRNLII